MSLIYNSTRCGGWVLRHVFKSWELVWSEVLKAVSTKMAVCWVVAPCRLVRVYRRFRGPYCLHHQGDELILVYMVLQPRRQPFSDNTCSGFKLVAYRSYKLPRTNINLPQVWHIIVIRVRHQNTVNMEEANTSETSVKFYQFTLHNIPEDSHLQQCC
jgi:hypothetical protein